MDNTTEEWSLAKYLEDWPPEGTDVHNAKTFGVVFIVMMAIFFCFCLSADLQFCTNQIIRLKKKVSKGQIQSGGGGTRKGKHSRKAKRSHMGKHSVPRLQGQPRSDIGHGNDSLDSLLEEGKGKCGRKGPMLMTYDNPCWNDYEDSPPPYSSARRHSNSRY